MSTPARPDPIRVVIADDHPLFREGVVRSLAEAGGIEVVGEAGGAEEALARVAAEMPDVVCLDISMPGGGIEAARRISAACPAVAIVMLTASEDDEAVMAALAAGASGYVLKGVGAPELVTVIESVARGGSYVSPALAGRLLGAMRAGPRTAAAEDPFDSLTRREEQILQHLAQGLSNKEIGRLLNLQEKTVKHYMTNILQKLQVRNRVEAALMARERGV